MFAEFDTQDRPLLREETLPLLDGVSKAERYGWKIRDEPGELRMLDKTLLLVDASYQRDARKSNHKLLAIARDWSWIACGVLIVALRDGKYYVIDGQHRAMAAMKRSDIQQLPCVVFKTASHIEEATGFIATNTNRKPITSTERHRAMLISGDPIAAIIQQLADEADRTITIGGADGYNLCCVAEMAKCIRIDKDALTRIWPIIVAVCEGDVIQKRVVGGLFYIERNMPEGTSLLDKMWQERILKFNVRMLLTGINSAQNYYGKGGNTIYAKGILQVLNKGHRTELRLREDTDNSEAEAE